MAHGNKPMQGKKQSGRKTPLNVAPAVYSLWFSFLIMKHGKNLMLEEK